MKKNKTILITGGLGLIGRKVSEEAMKMGYNVIIGDIKDKKQRGRARMQQPFFEFERKIICSESRVTSPSPRRAQAGLRLSVVCRAKTLAVTIPVDKASHQQTTRAITPTQIRRQWPKPKLKVKTKIKVRKTKL